MKRIGAPIRLALALVAITMITIPVIGIKARASANRRQMTATMPPVNANGPVGPPTPSNPSESTFNANEQKSENNSEGTRVPRKVLEKWGIPLLTGPNKTEQSKAIAQQMIESLAKRKGKLSPQAGEPINMSAGAALSTALITNEGGRGSQFDEVLTLADWNGQEQYSANHSGKVDDFSGKTPTLPTGPSEFQLTRTAISEHTIANGFAEDIFYYGDSFGNVYVNATTNLISQTGSGNVFSINLPTAIGAYGSLASDDQIVVTGLAVSPVCDLSAFAHVNPAYSSFSGLTGEILYVAFTDTESGFQLQFTGAPSSTTLVRSGLLALPVADIPSGAANLPGIASPAGFPVQVGGAFAVEFSVFSNEAGVAVDDDGSAYVQQVDLIGGTGANIVKIASTDDPLFVLHGNSGWQDRSLATSGAFILTTLNPVAGQNYAGVPPFGVPSTMNGSYGEAVGPVGLVVDGVTITQISTATNYSGTASLFGNIEALAAGPCNNIYAAVARSGEPGDPPSVQATEGPYSTGGTALGATPSMVIRFSDVVGAFAPCSLPMNPITGAIINGVGLPIGDGFADVVPPAGGGAIPAVVPGVNNFIIFVEGDGPDLRSTTSGNSIGATTANTLQINDGVGFQVDPNIYSGIAVDREGTVYVVSGGTPAGIGSNPSPTLGEILAFPDNCPQDGRADFIDLRTATTLPNPPGAGTNLGDGLSTRADHIFWIAPIDVVNGESDPTAIAGLNIGFELYINRLRTADNTPELPNGNTQQQDGSNGPVIFEQFDPSHQVAGGDDQTFPFTGDDDDGAGNNGDGTVGLTGPLSGGFEFMFANPLGDVFTVGAACGTGNGVWNGFFANSDGNITFGGGDSSGIANEIAFRSGLPKIAAAWCGLNSSSRGTDNADGVPTGMFPNTFPVQAFGFASTNDFEIRFINIPEDASEPCGSSNTFSTFLFDDGTGVDENASQPLNPANPIGNNAVPFNLQEGPTANRFVTVNIPGANPALSELIGCPPRQDGTGHFCFLYGRMDLVGTGPNNNPVIVGFSIGNQSPLNPPGICGIDLGSAAVAADGPPTNFGPDPGTHEVGLIEPCLIGEGTEPTIFELFDTGTPAGVSESGNPIFVTPDFDLRCEGNGGALAAAINTRQIDRNRGRVCFYGTTCQLPPNPVCQEVVPTPTVAVPPGDAAVGSAAAATPVNGHQTATPTAGIINALCNVQLNVLGCGIYPNETTIICSLPETGTGEPETRPGKTVTTAMQLGCDTNGDGTPDLFVNLANVTPINVNLLQGTLSTANSGLPGSAFPLACCGGFASLVTTTTFSAGDNNIFNLLASGGFTRVMTCTIDLGTRAPVVISATPSQIPNCGLLTDIDIPGSCFILPNGTINVTSVFAVDSATGAIIQATAFTILSPTEIDAAFNFGSANAGHTFLIFVSGPNGISRNLNGTSGTCPSGNEQGILVTVTCGIQQQPPPLCPRPAPVITSCSLNRSAAGKEILTVSATNVSVGATITIGGITPAHSSQTGEGTGGTTTFTLKGGGICKGLPGAIIITNPAVSGQPPNCPNQSVPFECNESCPK